MSKLKAPHLVVVLTAHGFGHAAMTAPVVNALRQRHPDLRLTLRSTLPRWFLHSKYQGEFEIVDEACDFGFSMHDAFSVDVSASLARYREFHQGWSHKIAAEQQRLREMAPDLILSNVAYLPFAAAKQLNIPAVGLCCLNWADLFHHYMAGASDAERIEHQIRQAYLDCSAFICPAPSMEMAWLCTHHVDALGTLGRPRRNELLAKLGLDANQRLVLVSLGGIKTELDITQWPVIDNVHYLVPAEAQHQRDDCHAFESLYIPFIDALASCDVFLTKPGYGAFSEAALNGTPVLYTERDNWPEQASLTTWLADQTPQRAISQGQLATGDFAQALSELLSASRPSAKPSLGIDESVRILRTYL